ncbi:MAG: zf-HC2 domain-containing protein [Bacteroidaceae bacterium]|nr:zf-HC2 domain-containing protein [Bacteroidaceae bacterium]
MDCKEFRNNVADLFDREVDPQIKAECENHMSHCAECKEYYDDLQTAAQLLRPLHSPVGKASHASRSSRRLLKIAAMFAGVILLSGIAYAAIHLIMRPTADDQQSSTLNAQSSMLNGQSPDPVRFEYVRLDSILSVVSAHYTKAVSFNSDEAKAMKFILTWKPDAPLSDFIDGMNMFDGLQLTLQRDTIFVEAQEVTEDAE